MTSEANYVRDNYAHLLGELVDRRREQIAGVVVIRTVSAGLVAKAMGLYALGVRHISTILLKNSLRAKFGSFFARFERADIPVVVTEDINVESTRRRLEEIEPDLIINARTRSIFREEVLSIPRLGCINIHHGVLPRQRGTMCDLWALYEGRNPGFSIHEMTPKIDEGPILEVCEHTEWDSPEYYRLPYWSSLREAEVLNEVIDRIDAAGGIEGRPNRAPEDEIVFRTDPDARQIRKMRAEGIVL